MRSIFGFFSLRLALKEILAKTENIELYGLFRENKKEVASNGSNNHTFGFIADSHHSIGFDDFRFGGLDKKPPSQWSEMDVGRAHCRHQYHRTHSLLCHWEEKLLNIVEVERLTKRYGQENAAEGLSFALEKGTATALIGPNGAGKTTTLSMLAALLSPSSGRIEMADGLTIGFLPQYPQFFPWLTALEFTEMAAKLSGIEAKKTRLQATRTLEFVGLGTALTKKIGAFSGGMKQRLGLAQAIVHQPRLLLLDEPISALDPTGRREIMDLLKSLQQDTTILYSTHILNDAEEMTDQLLFMKDGRLIEQGSLDDVRNRHANPHIRIRFQNQAQAAVFAEGHGWRSEIKKESIFLPVQENGPTMQQVLQVLAAEKLDVLGIEFQTASLEEIFLKVVAAK